MLLCLLFHLVTGVAEPAADHMNAYIWEEGEAARGADNIISCLYNDLLKRGVIDLEGENVRDDALGHLVLAADNCSGQNKNKAMIKFCMWLREAGYVKKVTILFLIKGHTKNHCDHGFNLLKHGTRGKNLYTGSQLDAAYTENNEDYITLQRLVHLSFYGWTEGLNLIYRDPPSGSVLCNHVFTFGDDDDGDDEVDPTVAYYNAGTASASSRSLTTYTRQEFCSDDADKHEFDLLPTQFDEVEREDLLNHLPNRLKRLPAPGLSAIKANECQNKLGPLVPEKDRWYWQRLTNELKEAHEKEKAAKNQRKADTARQKKQRIDEANS